MKRSLCLIFMVLFVASVQLILSPAQAAPLRHSGRVGRVYGPRHYGGRRYSRPVPPAPLPQVSTAEVDTANQRLLAARAELQRAQRAFDQFYLSGRNPPGLAAALSDLQEARVAHERADAAVARSLRDNSEYTAALAHKEQMQRRLDLLRDSGAGNPEQITALATEAMQWGSTATRIQADAENADPAVTGTKAKLLAAEQRVRALTGEADQSLRSDPAWLAARQARDQAKSNLAAAEANLLASQQRLAAARNAYNQASLFNQRHGYFNNRATRPGRH